MAMSRDTVSYVTRMFYFLFEIIIFVKINKFMYFNYIDIAMGVYAQSTY